MKIKPLMPTFLIGYKDDKKLRPLCIKLPKMNRNVNSFKEIKYMSFDFR